MEIVMKHPIHPDHLEDLFLSLFGATVIVWFKDNIACIDILETTPQLENIKKNINQQTFDKFYKI